MVLPSTRTFSQRHPAPSALRSRSMPALVPNELLRIVRFRYPGCVAFWHQETDSEDQPRDVPSASVPQAGSKRLPSISTLSCPVWAASGPLLVRNTSNTVQRSNLELRSTKF